MTAALAKRKAEQALAAVRARYAAYFQPETFPATEAAEINGEWFPATAELVCPPMFTEDQGPKLIKGFYDDRNWAIVWEDGPFEWAYRASMGGYDPETAEAVLAAGGKPKAEDPIGMPAGVFAEPIYTFALGLYPAS